MKRLLPRFVGRANRNWRAIEDEIALDLTKLAAMPLERAERMSEVEDDNLDEAEWVFDEKLALEQLDELYSPGNYAEGENLCLEILEELNPNWEPARLYLLLNLAALDCEEEALQMVDDLSSESLLEALRHLAFGAGTQTEGLVYEDVIACARARGLEAELEAFFSTVEKPWPRTDVGANLSNWD